MRSNVWYYRWYARNWLSDQKRRYRRYGLMAFMPHRHVPFVIPAGDGWYCVHCGTRNATVQRKGRNSLDATQRNKHHIR